MISHSRLQRADGSSLALEYACAADPPVGRRWMC
jgi:hypothetical protein